MANITGKHYNHQDGRDAFVFESCDYVRASITGELYDYAFSNFEEADEWLRGNGYMLEGDDANEIEFTDELIGILYERSSAEANLADAVTKLERQYWSGVVDTFDLVIRMMTGYPSNEVYAELNRRNGYTV